MRAIHRTGLKLLVAGLLFPILSCASGDLDSGDSANVVMLVGQIPQIPEIQTAFDATSNTCTFTVTPVSVTLKNRPKNTGGTIRPFNDIQLQSVTISYIWDTLPASTTAPRTFALGGTVPAGGTVAVSFPPIALADLNPAVSGHTATSVTMLFRGRTVSGEDVSAPGTGASLSIKQCPFCPDTDLDGVCDATDNCLNDANIDQADADADNIGDVCDACPSNPNPQCVTP